MSLDHNKSCCIIILLFSIVCFSLFVWGVIEIGLYKIYDKNICSTYLESDNCYIVDITTNQTCLINEFDDNFDKCKINNTESFTCYFHYNNTSNCSVQTNQLSKGIIIFLQLTFFLLMCVCFGLFLGSINFFWQRYFSPIDYTQYDEL